MVRPAQDRQPETSIWWDEKLASRIERELEVVKAGHYAAYEDELQHIWPLNEENRKAKIAQFAREYGFHLAYYKEGLCAIFQKGPSSN